MTECWASHWAELTANSVFESLQVNDIKKVDSKNK
jgi:hypothetical protein